MIVQPSRELTFCKLLRERGWFRCASEPIGVPVRKEEAIENSRSENRSATLAFSRDAFSSGQVGSKIWLIQLLERLISAHAPSMGLSGAQTIWILGGWEGVLGFLLLARAGLESSLLIQSVRSFDLDPKATERANVLCENWVWREWMFRAFTVDCNDLDYGSSEWGTAPTLVINTSVEHFGASREWFDRIPAGTIVALQASDFSHDGADHLIHNESDLAKQYPMTREWFRGSMKFDYGNWSFHRLMTIGVK